MNLRILSLLWALHLTASVSAQHYDISRHEADSMLVALPKSKVPATRIDLLLNLAQYHIFKPGENKSDLDSGQAYIDEAKKLNKSQPSREASGYILVNESYLLREKELREEGQKKAEEAIRVLQSGNNKGYLGRALYELSMYLSYEDSAAYSQKRALIQQASATFRQGGDLLRTARSMEMLGDIYIGADENTTALQILKGALQLYDSIGYGRTQGVHILLGSAYREMDDYGMALYHQLNALKAFELAGDSSAQMCQTYNQIGLIYSSVRLDQTAIRYYTKALEIAKKLRDSLSCYQMLYNIGYAYSDRHQPDSALKTLAQLHNFSTKKRDPVMDVAYNRIMIKCYLQLKQYKKAEEYCRNLEKIAKTQSLAPGQNIGLLVGVASYYLFTSQLRKARLYLTQCIHLTDSLHYEGAMVNNLQGLYKLDSAEGNFKSAFNNLVRFKAKQDSISGERTKRQMVILSVEYEVAKKQDSIQLRDKDILILQQTNKLQKGDLRQATLTRNIIIAGILVSLIIIALLYRQYKNKQKSNTIISQKNEQLEGLLVEKEWLLKEIHHRVKNNFQTVMSLLGTQSSYLKNDIAVNAINDSQQRIQAMLLIHQRLYKSNNLSSVPMNDYVRELVSSLSDSYDGDKVLFKLEIEPVELDLAHSIPLGLILNEAITNAFKYAFPDNRTGLVSILFTNAGENNYQLTIQDNGIGLPAGFNLQRTHSMGMSLMRRLVGELNGTFEVDGSNGTRIDISFVYEPAPAMAHHEVYL